MKNQETSVQYLDIYSSSFWSLDKETKEAALVNELSKIKVRWEHPYNRVESFEIWTNFPNTEFRLNALTTIFDSKNYRLKDDVLTLLVKDFTHEISSPHAAYLQRMEFLNLLARTTTKKYLWSIYAKDSIREIQYACSNGEEFYSSLSIKNAFKLIYNSTQRVNNSYSPIEIAAQNYNISFLINILKIKYNFDYNDSTKDLEQRLNEAFSIIITSTAIDYGRKGRLKHMLDYLQSFSFSGLETRLLANLKRQIWEHSQIEPTIKESIDLEYYNIDGNDIATHFCCDFFMRFLPEFSSSTRHSAATVAIQEAIPEDIPVATFVHEVELAETQALISSPNKDRVSKRAELQFG